MTSHDHVLLVLFCRGAVAVGRVQQAVIFTHSYFTPTDPLVEIAN